MNNPHPHIQAIQERFLTHYDASFQWLIQEAQKGCDHLTMSRLLKEMRNSFWELMGIAVKKQETQSVMLINQPHPNQMQHLQQSQPEMNPVSGPPPPAAPVRLGPQSRKRPRTESNGRELANYIEDSMGPAFTLEQANARINQIKSSNLHITVSSDMERVNEWLGTRPGTSGHSLTIEQRRDVVQFYEMFKPKYSVKWLIAQIEAKYGLSSLRGYFTRFMSKCYKVTNQGQKSRNGTGTGGSGATRGRKALVAANVDNGSVSVVGSSRGAGKYRSIESLLTGNEGNNNSSTTNGNNGAASNGIGRNRCGKLGQTAAEDQDRVEAWILTGSKRDGNLTVDQKKDVILFFETFRDKYIPAWLAKQIARKYDMKKLQFDFNRFMARCYKSTGAIDEISNSDPGVQISLENSNVTIKVSPDPEMSAGSSSGSGSKTPIVLPITARMISTNPSTINNAHYTGLMHGQQTHQQQQQSNPTRLAIRDSGDGECEVITSSNWVTAGQRGRDQLMEAEMEQAQINEIADFSQRQTTQQVMNQMTNHCQFY